MLKEADRLICICPTTNIIRTSLNAILLCLVKIQGPGARKVYEINLLYESFMYLLIWLHSHIPPACSSLLQLVFASTSVYLLGASCPFLGVTVCLSSFYSLHILSFRLFKIIQKMLKIRRLGLHVLPFRYAPRVVAWKKFAKP